MSRVGTQMRDKHLRAFAIIWRTSDVDFSASVALPMARYKYVYDYDMTLDVVCALLTQPCWWYRPPDVQHSVTVHSQWLRHVRGTACRRLSGMHRR